VDQTEEESRKLTPKYVGIEDAITTLELLPAILYSPVADELLTAPTMDAVMQAKWLLLQPFWCLGTYPPTCWPAPQRIHHLFFATYLTRC
jgi:hypothetical protein